MKEPFYIKVRVKTKQKKEELKQTSKNQFEVSLVEKAERGLANKRLLKIFGQYYKNPSGGVSIISGAHNPIKLLKVGR
jgi:uncharacterized protein YggU (UPF0235/DUF167 family)